MSSAAVAEKPLSPGQRIVHALVDTKGLTPAEIGRQLGIRSMTVRDILRGKSSGGNQLEKLSKFARLMGLSDDDLGDAAAFASDGPLSGPPDAAAAVEFDIPDAPPPPPPPGDASVKDRIKAMLNGNASDFLKPLPAGEEAAGRAMQKRMAEQLTPIAALLIVLAAAKWGMRGPYARCNPTTSEAELMIYPLMSALSRRMDAAKALSEDSMDVVLCLGAVVSYGYRAMNDHRRITEALYAQARANPGAGADAVRAFAGPGGSPDSTPAGQPAGADPFAAFAVASAPSGNGHARPPADERRGERRAQPRGASGDVPAHEHPSLRGLLDADFAWRQEHGRI